MKTTLRRVLSWDNRASKHMPHDERKAPYNVRTDLNAYGLDYGVSRSSNKVH